MWPRATRQCRFPGGPWALKLLTLILDTDGFSGRNWVPIQSNSCPQKYQKSWTNLDLFISLDPNPKSKIQTKNLGLFSFLIQIQKIATTWRSSRRFETHWSTANATSNRVVIHIGLKCPTNHRSIRAIHITLFLLNSYFIICSYVESTYLLYFT